MDFAVAVELHAVAEGFLSGRRTSREKYEQQERGRRISEELHYWSGLLSGQSLGALSNPRPEIELSLLRHALINEWA
jgi:hypothetical protein